MRRVCHPPRPLTNKHKPTSGCYIRDLPMRAVAAAAEEAVVVVVVVEGVEAEEA